MPRCVHQVTGNDLIPLRDGPTCWIRHLRILAAGGDGTVAWILKSIEDLELEPAPPVAVLPLGTGNDLALSFGWGNMFSYNWIKVR